MDVIAVGVGDHFASTVTGGPLLVALVVAALAGLVSAFSPCMLPLIPGYLSYMAGLSGKRVSAAETAGRPTRPGEQHNPDNPHSPGGRHRWRVLAGGLLFVSGFTAVFVSYGALFGGLGRVLLVHERLVETVLGGVVIVFGLAFAGLPLDRLPGRVGRLLSGLGQQARPIREPRAGLAGAPLLGVVFAVGWTPCVGPTLGAVQTLAYTSASAGRGALLAAAYCLGLGFPLLVAAVGFDRGVGRFGFLRRQSRMITLAGATLMVFMGLLLVTGTWGELMIQLRVRLSGYGTII